MGSFWFGIRQAVTKLHQESGVEVVMSWEENTTVLRTDHGPAAYWGNCEIGREGWTTEKRMAELDATLNATITCSKFKQQTDGLSTSYVYFINYMRLQIM